MRTKFDIYVFITFVLLYYQVHDIADVYNKNRQRVPQESTGICLSGVVYHRHKYHGLDITLMQERVAILTITAKPYQEGSAVSHAVLCNPTILWGDLEIKKQGKFCQVKITYFFCNFMMHAMS